MMRSKTLRKFMIKRLLTLSLILVLFFESITLLILYGNIKQNALKASSAAMASADNYMALLVNSINNVSNMITFNSSMQSILSQNILFTEQDGNRVAEIRALFASSMLYSQLIDNIIVFDAQKNYFTSMYVCEQTQEIQKYFDDADFQQSYGQTLWYRMNEHGNNAFLALRKIQPYNISLSSSHELGYIAITINAHEIYEMLANFRYSPDSEYYIVDKDWNILAGSDFLSLEKDSLSTSLESNGNYYMQLEDGRALVSYCSNAQSGWLLVEVTPELVILEPLLTWFIAGLGVFVLLFIVFVLVSYWVSQSIVQPFQKMQNAMKEVEEGNFDFPIIPKTEIDEIDKLMQRFHVMSYRLDTLIDEVYCAKIKENELILIAQQAEIEMLQQQINPHFLYNTLDSINWMANMGAMQEVSQMIMALSDFFRFTTGKHGTFVKISEEINFVRNYAYLQQIRFGPSLSVKISVDPQAEDYLIPRLLLQPLVENSLKYGITGKGGSGLVEISVQKEGQHIVCVVQDNGIGMNQESIDRILSSSSKTANIGLPNIIRRLRLIFHQEYTLQINSKEQQGTTVTISFPAFQDENELKSI